MPVTIQSQPDRQRPDDPDRVHLAIVNPDHIYYHSTQLQKDLLDLYQHSPGNAGQASGNTGTMSSSSGRAGGRTGN